MGVAAVPAASLAEADHGRTRGPGAAKRLGVVTIDQAVSGGSNFLASILAAHSLSVTSFGRFGLILIVFGLVLGVLRAAVSMPVLVRPVDIGPRLESAVRGTWLFGLTSALLLAASAAVAGPFDATLARGLLTLAVCIPLIGIQDLARFVAIGMLRPVYALWLDLGWLMLFVAVGVPYLISGRGSLVEVLALWAGAGAVTGLVATAAWAPLRTFRPSPTWLIDNWQLSWRFTMSFGSAQASALLLAVVVRGLAGSATLGAFVGTQLLTRPYTTVEAAVVGSGVAEISNSGGRGLSRHLRRVTLAATGVAAVNAGIMLTLPDWAGERILGGTWPHAQPYLLPFALQLLAMGLSIGPRVGFIGLDRVDLSMRISLMFAGLILVTALLGCFVAGGLGCAWTLTGGWYLIAGVWWTALIRVQRSGKTSSPPTLAPI